MKLSTLLENLQELARRTESDPEVTFKIGSNLLELDVAESTSTVSVDMQRGVLTPTPKWDETVTIYFLRK